MFEADEINNEVINKMAGYANAKSTYKDNKSIKNPLNYINNFIGNKEYFMLVLALINIMIIGFLVYLIVSLFSSVTSASVSNLMSIKTVSAFKITLGSIVISQGIVSLLGIVLAFYMRDKYSLFYNICHYLMLLPILLPPTVAGLVLLKGLGKASYMSQLFFDGRLSISFSFIGIVVIQVFITLPYFYQIALYAFNQSEDSIIEAAKVDGASHLIILTKILIPVHKKKLEAGLLLTTLRAISEFGATIMFVGNLEGKTQTVTTRIYQLYQTNLTDALTLSVLQVIVFVLPAIWLFKRK